MGLIGMLLVPVALGSELYLMRPDHFLRRPGDWLATFAHHGAEHSAAPNFALEHLLRRTSPADLHGMDLSGWKTLFVGADRVSFPTLQAVTRLLAPFGLPPTTLTPSYGMAEATLMVCSPHRHQVARALTLSSGDFRPGAAVEVIAEHDLGGPPPPLPAGTAAGRPTVVSCGPPAAGVRIEVMDDGGQVLPELHVGQLRIASPALSRGYLGAVPGGGFSAAGYLSGDLGFRYGGEVFVLGRVGDSIKVNGRFVIADDVGAALAPVLDLPVSSIVVVLQDLQDGPATLVAVQQEPRRLDARALGDALSALALAPERTAVIRIPRAALPLTTSGKPQRQELWQQVSRRPVRGQVLYRGTSFPVPLGRQT